MSNFLKVNIQYIAKEKNILHVIIYFFIIPLIVSASPICFNFELITNEGAGNIISGLSLFIGFFFSLIFVISDRIQLKKDELKSCNEIERSRKSLLNAYIDFGQRIVGTITLTVYVSLALIVLILLSEVQFNFTFITNSSITIFLQTINLYLGTILLYLIVFILNEMYNFFYGQMQNS